MKIRNHAIFLVFFCKSNTWPSVDSKLENSKALLSLTAVLKDREKLRNELISELSKLKSSVQKPSSAALVRGNQYLTHDIDHASSRIQGSFYTEHPGRPFEIVSQSHSDRASNQQLPHPWHTQHSHVPPALASFYHELHAAPSAAPALQPDRVAPASWRPPAGWAPYDPFVSLSKQDAAAAAAAPTVGGLLYSRCGHLKPSRAFADAVWRRRK